MHNYFYSSITSKSVGDMLATACNQKASNQHCLQKVAQNAKFLDSFLFKKINASSSLF